MNIWRIIFFLREYFFPRGCPLCGTALINTEETWYGLCQTCLAKIRGKTSGEGQAEERCQICGRPLVSEKGICLPCRNVGKRHFDRILTLYPYTGKFRRLLGAYKFGRNLALGNFFAEQIRKTLERLPLGDSADCKAETPYPAGGSAAIVPVPPRPGKIKKTGWDQIEYLAALLEKLSIRRCLKRLPSKSQKELNRENRISNLKGRIILTGTPPETAVLIDDVITTGSTMDTCAEVLKTGGAKRVYGICLFYS